jgi:glucokinase-like ROK family protein
MHTYRTGDQTLVRDINLSSVLRYLQSRTPLSRAQIAAMTGLNKSTVSSLVEELIERGLVHEIGLNSTGAGRPSTLLELNPQAGIIIGTELGVDFYSVIMTDFVGQMIWRCQQESDPTAGQVTALSQLLQLLDEAIEIGRDRGARLLGIGVSTPGTVNVESGMLAFAPNLQWRHVPMQQIVSEHTGLPVIVDNDANAAALGEHLFGVACHANNFIFIFAGVGIGGGLFLNGELYRGASGFAGEIGHTTLMVEQFQSPCHCGNRGCWETYANQYSIIESVRARLEVHRSSLIPALMAEHHSPITLPIITEAAQAGDTEAVEALTEAGAAIGLGVANLINIFNPEMIVIGGPLSAAGQFLLPTIQERAKRRSLPDLQSQASIVLSASGADASLIGAVALVVESILQYPTRILRLNEGNTQPDEVKGGELNRK